MAFTYSPVKETVGFEGGSIEIRGLTFPDLAKLIDVNRESILPIVEKYRGHSGDELLMEKGGEILLDVVTSAPVLVAHVICLAADLEGEFNQIAQLPLGIMVQLIERIVDLTFRTSGGSGNLGAIVQNLVRKAVAETQQSRASTL